MNGWACRMPNGCALFLFFSRRSRRRMGCKQAGEKKNRASTYRRSCSTYVYTKLCVRALALNLDTIIYGKLQMPSSQVSMRSVPPNVQLFGIAVLPRNPARGCPGAGGWEVYNFPPDLPARLPQHPRAGNRVLCVNGVPSSTPGRHGHPQVIWLCCNFSFLLCFISAYSLPWRRKALSGVASCDLDSQFIWACNFIQLEGLSHGSVNLIDVLGVHTHRMSFKKTFIAFLREHLIPTGSGVHWKKIKVQRNLARAIVPFFGGVGYTCASEL